MCGVEALLAIREATQRRGRVGRPMTWADGGATVVDHAP